MYFSDPLLIILAAVFLVIFIIAGISLAKNEPSRPRKPGDPPPYHPIDPDDIPDPIAEELNNPPPDPK